MRRLVFLLFITCTFFACKEQVPFNEMEVKKVLEIQQEAWNRGDIVAFMEGYEKSDSTRFISKNAVTYGWQQVLDRYKKSYPDIAAMGKLTFELLHVEELNDETASVTGKWTLKEIEVESSGHFLLILKKTDTGWKIVVDCTS